MSISTLYWVQDGELMHRKGTVTELDYAVSSKNLGVSYMYRYTTVGVACWSRSNRISSLIQHIPEVYVPDNIRALHMLLN